MSEEVNLNEILSVRNEEKDKKKDKTKEKETEEKDK